MIKVKVLSGQYIGREREFGGINLPFDPLEVLGQMVHAKISWEINYSQATKEEAFLWFRADLVARIICALIQGRFVQFMDQRWQLKSGEKLGYDLIAKIEDYIVNSGFMVTIAGDDEKGLIVKTGGPENLNPDNN